MEYAHGTQLSVGSLKMYCPSATSVILSVS